MYLPIQYLRGIAAVLVVFAHFRYIPVIKDFCGGIGVDIFFIISGYIMSLTSDNYINKKNIFLAKRIIRIYPLYLFYFLCTCVFLFYFESLGLKKVLISVFFIGGIKNYSDPILFSGWSIFYEFVFYLILTLFIKKKRILLWILVFLGAMDFIVRPTDFTGYFFNQFYLYFLIGILIQINETKVQSIRLFKFKFLNLFFSIILILTAMRYNDYSDLSIFEQFIPRKFIYVEGLPIDRILFWGIPSAYFVISFINYYKFKSEVKILRYLGDISYSIYIVHTFLYIIWHKIVSENEFVLNNNNMIKVIVFALPLILVLPISHLSYQLIEKGVSKKLNYYVDKNIN